MRFCGKYIPHLGFPLLAQLTLCRLIRRMNLYRKIFLCINKFDQNRKFIFWLKFVGNIFWKLIQYFFQCFPLKCSISDRTFSIRMTAEFPAFCCTIAITGFSKQAFQFMTAPKIILVRRSQFHWIHIITLCPLTYFPAILFAVNLNSVLI